MKSKNEAYLDAEEKFYDYGTGKVSGNDIFDVNKTGMSFYDSLIEDPKYMKENKNLISEIKMMSPNEYFEEVSKIFNSTKENQIKYTQIDKDTIEKLKEVILKYKRKFPLAFLNYADNTQEGRHRLYVAGELFGWDTEFPVLIVNWADPEKHEKEVREKEIETIKYKIEKASDEALNFKYKNLDDFLAELEWTMDSTFGDGTEDVEYDIEDTENSFIITKDGVSYEIPKSNIMIDTERKDEEDINLDDLDLDELDTELEKLLKK